MAARLFNKGKEHLLGGDIDLKNDTIVALLVSGLYVPGINDESRAAIPSNSIVAEVTVTSTKILDGIFDADDTLFTDVTGVPITQIILIKDDDVYSKAFLIAIIDDAAQLPVTPDGTNITIQWDNGPNKIFSI